MQLRQYVRKQQPNEARPTIKLSTTSVKGDRIRIVRKLREFICSVTVVARHHHFNLHACRSLSFRHRRVGNFNFIDRWTLGYVSTAAASGSP
jgi:hypothetical protein